MLNIHPLQHFKNRIHNKKHVFFIKNDFKRYSIYSLFSSFEVNSVILLLYLVSIFGNYTTASLMISIRILFTIFQKIFLSSFKDRIDFKYTLSLAEFSSAIGYMFYGLSIIIPNFLTEIIILGLFFDALGSALWSGTYNASLYVKFESEENKKNGATPYGKLQTMLMIGIGLGQVTGGALASLYSYNIAMWFGAIPNIIAGILALSLKKNNRKKVVQKEKALRHFLCCFKRVITKKELKYLFLGNISRNTITSSFDEFIVPFYKTFLNISTIGIILAIKQVLGGISFWFSGDLVKKIGFGKSVKYSLLLRSLCEVFGVFFNSYLSPIFLTIRTVVLSPMDTSLSYTIQNEVSDKDRTTIYTVMSVFTSITSAISIIIIGLIADITTLWFALAIIVPFKIIPYYYYNKAFYIIENSK